MGPEVSKYLAKFLPYSAHLFDENFQELSPEAWWASGARLGFDKKSVDLAASLVSACPAASGLERCFSTLGLTYGKLRAQLGVEKAGKLAFLFKKLNSC